MRKIITALLASALIVSMTACAGAPKNSDTSSNSKSESSAVKPKINVGDVEFGGAKADLMHTFSADECKDIYSTVYSYNGLYYKTSSGDDKMYGVIAVDDYVVGDAKYKYLDIANSTSVVQKTYYIASTKDTSNLAFATSKNCYALVDQNGKEVIPEEYAAYNVLNDRFVKATKIIDETNDKDEALLYANTDGEISFSPNNSAVYYSGKWVIFDMEKGAIVPNVSGKTNRDVYAYGNIIMDDKEYFTADGKKIELSTLYNNGDYRVENNGTNTMYDKNGNKLFTFSSKDYSISYCENSQKYGDYYIVSTYTDEGSIKFAIDRKGEKISSRFYDYINACGNMLTVDDSDSKNKKYLADFKGNKIYDGVYDKIEYNKNSGLYMLCNKIDNDYHYDVTVIDEKGNVAANIVESDSIDFDFDTMNVTKKSGDNRYFYCYNNQDYVIAGNGSCCDLTVKAEASIDAGNEISLFDVFTGEKIIKGNYSSLICTRKGNMVFAKNSDGSFELYKISYDG